METLQGQNEMFKLILDLKVDMNELKADIKQLKGRVPIPTTRELHNRSLERSMDLCRESAKKLEIKEI